MIGSRAWARLDEVALKVSHLYDEHGQFILVSGGADGVCKMAESTAQAMGLPVISFRPVKRGGGVTTMDTYGVDEWRLHKGAGKIVHHDHPTWATWDGAALFRSMLIAERADEGFAFWDGFSRGTGYEIDFFAGEDTPLEVIK